MSKVGKIVCLMIILGLFIQPIAINVIANNDEKKVTTHLLSHSINIINVAKSGKMVTFKYHIPFIYAGYNIKII